ncbi:M20/M25/M40 family metallo-hydrolase [Mucilaginibacter myungsuensis]|uniref:M28 family metallopeptidase n=1 Tax=Mucilaginibacter myungsuensis TaxID=649104 RepID=A0A929PXF9_9SPHI|nr:M28 family metallopeptidase [Mucilaginibacter myungsuensis]MBE9662360.1 M28 family metallopeptidase [Mucilaginibacter myungsuensis]MDN3599203.1 M28 family metallopeptidase [Mucilaginibacter myungsuensis]
MKYRKLLLTVPLLSLALLTQAQTTIRQDPAIKQMLDEVSAQNIEAIIRKLVTFKTRHTLSDTTSKTTGIGAARNWIKAEMEKYAAASGGRMKVEFQSFVQPIGSRVNRPTVLKNIIATLKGTDPNDSRVYVVSGHYDSIVKNVMDSVAAAPGAVDDASGTAVSMEICRVMAKRSFPATIIFMCVPGEEQGLLGSAYAAKKAKEMNWNVDAMLNNDIVGNTRGLDNDIKDNTRIRVFSEGVPSTDLAQRGDTTATRRISQHINSLVTNGGENDAPSRQLARYIKETAERYVENLDVKLIYRRDRFLRGGDHTSFQLNGFTAVRFTEMNEDFNRQHQYVGKQNDVDYGDIAEFADYTFIQKAARMNLSVLANLSLAPASPQNVGVVTSGLTNKTTLKWETPKSGKKPTGYYILMRETISPFWEKKIFVTGNETTLNYSKDNYFFAVQSVDAEGHESLPIYPKPLR